MPTDQEIRAYAQKLPTIYRDVLATFPEAVPDRCLGDGLTAETIIETIQKHSTGYRTRDVVDALDRLTDRRFLDNSVSEINEAVIDFYIPTPVGEQLITAVTGHTPATASIPELPVPTWGK